MSRPIFAVAALLAGCATPPPPPAPTAFAIERTTAGHALFLDICVRHLGAPEALQRQAERRSLQPVSDDMRGGPNQQQEPLRLFGLPGRDGAVGLGLAFTASARSCSVFFRDADQGLALAFTAQLALARTRAGADVTPIVRAATPQAATSAAYRVQTEGPQPEPSADWAFGLTIGNDGLAIFHAQVAPRVGTAPEVPRGVLRRAKLGGRDGVTPP